MAFQIYNWSCVSGSLNQGLVSAAIDTPSSANTVLQGSMNLFSYYSATDSVATIEGSNYFLSVIYDLAVNDIIMVTGTDSSIFLQVASVTLPANGSSGTVTTQSFTAAGTVGTSNITNLAVTSAKIANNAVGFTQLATTVGALATVPLTAAQINGMYAAPVSLVAGAGAGTFIGFEKLVLDIDYGTTPFAAGGAIAVQYANTVHGAGIAASASIAAASLTGVSASSQLTAGSVSVVGTNTALENIGLYLSNATAAFTTGDSTANAYVYYRVLSPA